MIPAPTFRCSICGSRAICAPISIWPTFFSPTVWRRWRNSTKRSTSITASRSPRPIAGLRWCRRLSTKPASKRTTRRLPISKRSSPAIPTMPKPGRHWAMSIAASRNSDAADAYDNAIKIRGSDTANSWPLLYARAVSYEQSGRWTLAEADLKAALRLSPQEPQLLNYLGYSWVDKGENLTEALQMLEKARALRPFDGYIADS